MTRQPDCTVSDDLMRMITEQGLDALPELIRIMLNAAMHAERQQYLRAAPYERTAERQGYANGYKPKTLKTRVGELTVAIPQVRRVTSDRIGPMLREVGPRLLTVAQRPLKLLEGVGGILVLNVAYIGVLFACVEAFGGSDDASMAANNTSAFNCRKATGGTSWSEHSYGRAIDVNPVQNPYVKGSLVLPQSGSAYVDRSRTIPGMIRAGDAVVRAFAAQGWAWGGTWTSLKDYQHFSTTGR